MKFDKDVNDRITNLKKSQIIFYPNFTLLFDFPLQFY